MKMIQQISVIGDGGWGTTVGVHLARQGYPVTLWGAFAENIEAIQQSGRNEAFLPGIDFPPTMSANADLAAAVAQADLIVLAVPSQYLEGVVERIKRLPYQGKTFLSVVKGIDTRRLLRMSQLIHLHLGAIDLAVLSGPTIAMEVAQGIPSTAVIAARRLALAKRLQAVVHSEQFRIYTNTDIVGLELGGSVKNIIALACGVCDGLGFGTNAKAAILTRGLVEMARLGQALGAKKKTFSGLAGLGDLVTTCVSTQSRNRYVGEQLGRGKTIAQILGSMRTVAEGVETAKAVHKLSRQCQVSMPICDEVFNIIYKGKGPQKAVTDLMRRRLKSE